VVTGPSSGAGATADGARATVVIVDDQPPFRSVARTVVAMLGWRVVAEAESGEEAVEAARAHRPDLVLMDINLPGISGIEAIRQIVAERPDARVILLSTYQGDDLPADASSCGAAAYVRKEDLSPAVLRGLFTPV